MRMLFSKSLPWVFLGVFLIGLASVYAYEVFLKPAGIMGETTTVAYGNVSVLVTVSGTVDANTTAKLSFPTTGVVKSVLVNEGDKVTKGEILASLGQESQTAAYNDALANLASAEAALNELEAGPRSEARTTTETQVAIAEQDLERTKTAQDQLVANAYRTYLSSDLEARPANKDSADTAPTITGSYTCGIEGTYTLSLFHSNAKSGYSYRLSGLETGTYNASTDRPEPLGTCGLYIQFDPNEYYIDQDWTIEIPNTAGASYLADKNAYELALKTRDNSIEAAEQALELAKNQQTLANAAPRTEDRNQAAARVDQAQAALAGVEAQIGDKTIRAPFDGTVTNIDLKVGEIGDPAKSITMIKGRNFDMKARIPEIDIAKVKEGDSCIIKFDAKDNEPVHCTVGFISPVSTEIEGVAYYEAHLEMDDMPDWVREGLNADIDIIAQDATNVLRVPKRFLIEDNGSYSVYVMEGGAKVKQKVEVGLMGSDGYAEVRGIDEGTTVIAP